MSATHILSGAVLPATCLPGALFVKTGASAGLYVCTATDTWTGPLSTGAGAGTVTTTGSPASGNLAKFSGATSVTNTDLTGDVTTSGGTATTLAASGVSASTYGDATHVAQVVVDAKGRVTSAANVAITGSGNATSTGAVGSEPGSPASGDLYLPNNGFAIERYSGSAWVPWGPLFPLTAPINGDFAWVNQGGASVSTTSGGVTLIAPANSGNNMRIRKKAVPTAPYSVTIGFIPHLQTSQDMGLVLRASGSGNLIRWVANNNGGLSWIVQRFNSPSSFNSTIATLSTPISPLSLAWLRITDNNTNRIFSVSYDGQTWLDALSESRTAFITPDEIGFFVEEAGNSVQSAMTLLHWKEA